MATVAHELAEQLRTALSDGSASPRDLQGALASIESNERDAFIDRVLELAPPPEDGPELPRGCVPYLPCAVDVLRWVLDAAHVIASDVVVDVGSGAGRAGALIHLLTGATVIGVEVQRALVAASRELAARLKLRAFSTYEADALAAPPCFESASVFFLYCPFGGGKLDALLTSLEPAARAREIRICAVDLPLPPRRWLTLVATDGFGASVWRSVAHLPDYAAFD